MDGLYMFITAYLHKLWNINNLIFNIICTYCLINEVYKAMFFLLLIEFLPQMLQKKSHFRLPADDEFS